MTHRTDQIDKMDLIYQIDQMNQTNQKDQTDRVFQRPARATYSGLSGFAVSPQSWGASFVGMVTVV